MLYIEIIILRYIVIGVYKTKSKYIGFFAYDLYVHIFRVDDPIPPTLHLTDCENVLNR